MHEPLFAGFERRVVACDGVSIHARTGGAGPPLLLLHGYPQNLFEWAHVAPLLAKRFTVVCADLRGYGDSSKPAPSEDLHWFFLQQPEGFPERLIQGDPDHFHECPALVCWGEGGVLPRMFDVAGLWSRRLARMVTATVPGGHFFVDQHPLATARVLEDILAKVAA